MALVSQDVTQIEHNWTKTEIHKYHQAGMLCHKIFKTVSAGDDRIKFLLLAFQSTNNNQIGISDDLWYKITKIMC